MKTDFVATHASGLESSWRNFSYGGKFQETDSVIGGGMTGRSILRVDHQGGQSFRIKLFSLVFDKTGVFARWMFVSALSDRN